MKGIILAGGSGTRLYPLTVAISKQLLPIYNKPLIYYPLSILMLAGIREVLIISTERDSKLFQELLGDGNRFGIKISYEIQEEPRGIGEAFIIGEKFIGDDTVALVLGDNIFYGYGFTGKLLKARELNEGAIIPAYYVKNPESFGVVEFDEQGNVISLEEKPKYPKSNYIVPGLYFYDNSVVAKAKELKFSERNELEITDINRMYLEENKLSIMNLGRGMAWFDCGTHDGMLEASNFVKTIETRQGIMIASLEEIAYLKCWIDREKVKSLAEPLMKSEYGKYLMELIERC